MMRSIVAGKVMIYLLGYVVRKLIRMFQSRGVWFGNSRACVVFFDLDGTLHQQDMFGSFCVIYCVANR